MSIPLKPLFALGATALVGWRIYETQKKLEDVVATNTLAKLERETAEREIALFRENATDALKQLGEDRTRVWAGPMSRIIRHYQQPVNECPERSSLADMAGVPLLTQEQLAHITESCQQASFRLDAWERAGDSSLCDIPGLNLPEYVLPDLPHDLTCTSLMDWVNRLFLASDKKRLEELARDNEEWANQLEDEFYNSEEMRHIQDIAAAARTHSDLLKQLSVRLDRVLDRIEQKPFNEANNRQKDDPAYQRLLASALRYSHVLLMLLDAPIVTEQGALHADQQRAVDAARELLVKRDDDASVASCMEDRERQGNTLTGADHDTT